MQIHELKTDNDVFQASSDGLKRFEIRLNDRNFQVGDVLILRETVHSGDDMTHGAPIEYTGRKLSRIVDFILQGYDLGYGLDNGWCVMSVSPSSLTTGDQNANT